MYDVRYLCVTYVDFNSPIASVKNLLLIVRERTILFWFDLGEIFGIRNIRSELVIYLRQVPSSYLFDFLYNFLDTTKKITFIIYTHIHPYTCILGVIFSIVGCQLCHCDQNDSDSIDYFQSNLLCIIMAGSLFSHFLKAGKRYQR